MHAHALQAGRSPKQRPTTRRSLLLASVRLAVAALAFTGTAAVHADDFPSRPIKIVVGFGPGGLGDIVARVVAQKMSDSMGKTVYVENAPGAGGITAAAQVAKAAPDGYTLAARQRPERVQPLSLQVASLRPRRRASR